LTNVLDNFLFFYISKHLDVATKTFCGLLYPIMKCKQSFVNHQLFSVKQCSQTHVTLL